MTLCRFAVVACLVAIPAFADEPFASGLKPGQRPGPYAFLLATGPQRGQSFCYICDTGDKPAAVIFTRSLTDPLGRLTAKLDLAASDGKPADFRAWLTLLDDGKTPNAEARLTEWGRQLALRTLPLGAFEDPVGPPSYRLHRDADVTVLLFVKQKVVANFAFKTGELNDAKIADVIGALDKLNTK